MIQLTVLPPAVAPVSGLPASAEMPEAAPIAAGFAALLGLRLDAGAVEDVPVDAVSAPPEIALPPETGNIDGNSLPDEMPLATDANTQDDRAEVSPVVATPLIPVLPLAVAVTVRSGSQQSQTVPPQATVPVPQASSLQLPQPQGEQPPAASVHALPRLSSPSVGETTLAPLPERARVAPAPQESAAVQTPAAPQILFAMPDAPVQSSPVMPLAPVRASAPHDFAALVDRLVEARDSALAVQAPRAVVASVVHADFGDIAIRFEHRGDALSVALSNPDPEFARAVQSVAPAMQSQMASDGGAPGQRHDAQAQGQAAGGSSGQSSQPQPQQRVPGRSGRDSASQANGGEGGQPRHGVFA